MRFLYPDPDQLTVYGPDNTTYWLMLFVRSEILSQFKVVYYLDGLIEAIALSVGYLLHIRGFARFWRLKPLISQAIHVNCLLMIAQMYSIVGLGIIARLLTILYETRILHISGLGSAPVPFLAIIRQSSYINAFYVLIVVTIERTCATIYVADYEKKPRLHIGFVLVSLIVCASYCTGYAIVTGVMSAFWLTSFIHLPNIFCALWFRWLIRYNKGRLTRLTDQLRPHADEYSLSLRLQLKENIWSMKKIEFGVYLLAFGLTTNIGLVFGPILTLTAPEQFETLQWFSCAGNLIYALSVLFTSPWFEIGIAVHTGRVPPAVQALFGRDYFTKKASVPRNECESYFAQLESQWSTLWVMVVDVTITMLLVPVPLFPVFGTLCYGLVRDISIHAHWFIVVVLLSMGSIAAAMNTCLHFRFEAALGMARKGDISRWARLRVLSVRVAMMVVMWLPAATFAQIGHYSMDEIEQLDEGDLAWVIVENVPIIIYPTQQAAIRRMFAATVAALIATTTTTVYLAFATFRALRRHYNLISERTRIIQKKLTERLIAQAILPISLLAVPLAVYGISILFYVFDSRINAICVCVQMLHSVVHSALLIALSDHYRFALSKWLRLKQCPSSTVKVDHAIVKSPVYNIHKSA